MAHETTTTPSTALALRATDVSVTLGGVRILREASLQVRRGEVHVLIGPNGAGKTTLANAITGHVPLTAGTVELGGAVLRGTPDRRAARRLGRKFQVPRVFPRLTVAQNLAVAARRGAGRDRATGATLLGDLDPSASVEALSHGQRQRLELLMVLAQAPEVIVLDEPTAGMTREEREELARLLRDLAPAQTFLVVEHDMDFVTAVADRVSFLQAGEVLLTGTHDVVVADPAVRAAYLGVQGAHAPRGARPTPERPAREPGVPALGALDVRGLTVLHGSVAGVRDVDLRLEPGQTLGIIGRNGAGKTTLLEGLAGTLRSVGDVALDGRDVSREPSWDRARLGIGLVAQGRRLFRDLTVAENLRLAETEPPGPGATFDVAALFPALDGLLDRRAGLLSGGEQQQVAIAQALLRRPSVLLLDEPTEGISPIVTEQIVQVLERLADEGLSFVLADQHRALVERLCDRFVALRGGTTAGGGALVPGALDAYDHRL